ncbi:MAG: hypothetical protein CL723_03410 [Chloroflexi bacterium]|nr:hypothetical protein [Chloroflexota bacterium]
MLKYALLGIGFMLLIEGLLYFFFSQQMKEMMKAIESMELERIKTIAIIVSIVGLCLIYFTIKFY